MRPTFARFIVRFLCLAGGIDLSVYYLTTPGPQPLASLLAGVLLAVFVMAEDG